MHNPLLNIIPQLLVQFPDGCSEYQLMMAIDNIDGGFPDLADDDELALFQKHFLIKNALYQLQQKYWQQDNLYLDIGQLIISLQPVADKTTGRNLPSSNGEQKLRDYYLDWQEFKNTDREAVDQLLNSFWQRYLNVEGRATALEKLELPEDADQQQIRHRYRQLAAQHHPDKGGDPLEFIALKEAYDILRG